MQRVSSMVGCKIIINIIPLELSIVREQEILKYIFLPFLLNIVKKTEEVVIET